MENRLDFKLRVLRGDEIALGPGKVALLEAIAACGSISGAARAMGMSYRRAWLLVDTMNRSFSEPLVITSPGGSKGGGASVTQTGESVMAIYRAMQRRSEAAIQDDAQAILKLLHPL
ncbi:winged helix-turn-helix domain-containing protein [Janthinobacterium sp. 17J80-10]|uniref:winged helix-turn-helix domain-containing protein n=1 Tax=Janthinobacterium sp. 17J80-10 TaxID=2497863 RepID=UPI0010056F15|nr:winged helix-turn-helix domain-containing protein [Janthinobacterium sp. 17J80-10]QAU34335.1 LysR family transcriptional regulator [Janthinobacterium sp. 17J80-10]